MNTNFFSVFISLIALFSSTVSYSQAKTEYYCLKEVRRYSQCLFLSPAGSKKGTFKVRMVQDDLQVWVASGKFKRTKKGLKMRFAPSTIEHKHRFSKQNSGASMRIQLETVLGEQDFFELRPLGAETPVFTTGNAGFIEVQKAALKPGKYGIYLHNELIYTLEFGTVLPDAVVVYASSKTRTHEMQVSKRKQFWLVQNGDEIVPANNEQNITYKRAKED